MKAAIYCVVFLSILGNSLSFSIYNNSLLLSCYKSKDVSLPPSSLCVSVTWTAAKLFQAPISIYSDPSPLPASLQNERAQDIYNSMLAEATTVTDRCTSVLQWLACSEAFPYCPVVARSPNAISYMMPCKWHCTTAQKLCGMSLSCDRFNEDSPCTIYVPDGNFYIPPEKGDLSPIPFMYLVLSILYGTMFLVYLAVLIYFAKFCGKPMPTPVAAMVFILGVRLTASFVSWYFWNTCAYNEGMCQFDRAYRTLAVTEFTEAMQFFLISYQAKFLTVNYNSTARLEFRGTIMCCCYFFVMLVVSRRFMLRAPSDFFFFFMIAAYAVLFYHMIYKHREENARMFSQLPYLHERTIPSVAKEIHYKTYLSYVYFYIAVGLFAVEIICQVLYVKLDISFFALLVFYESVLLLLILYLTFLWRPRSFSPFYFMDPVTNLTLMENDRRSREESAPNVVKVMGLGDKGDISGSIEVELAPLLTNAMNNYPQAITSLRQAKMSVILQNNGELQLGLHT